ncbi:MAG: hypothetical protein K5831_01130 [Brevundimonas sp.]|uniref:hypothetical protein n=1 Tax=Brevundimonas sp. TaxID=1871086 RepID=UPI002587BA39|nr:hypothetical protein [Brevundimonas sp.]MCV0413471.1 hypothetical protein [Brevundimonas sp.]
MTQTTPTPGQPLSEADVSLLQPGDWLRHEDGTVHRILSAIEGWVFVADWREPIRAFTFLGRPDQDGWIAWEGGENPVPGVRDVELRLRSGDEFTGSDVNAHGIWRHIWGEGDIIAYREHGQGDYVPYYAVYRGDAVLVRVPASLVVVQYADDPR